MIISISLIRALSWQTELKDLYIFATLYNISNTTTFRSSVAKKHIRLTVIGERNAVLALAPWKFYISIEYLLQNKHFSDLFLINKVKNKQFLSSNIAVWMNIYHYTILISSIVTAKFYLVETEGGMHNDAYVIIVWLEMIVF